MDIFDDNGSENVEAEAQQPAQSVTGGDQVADAPKLTLDALPEDLRNEKMFENLKGKGDADLITEMAKQLQGSQRLLGNSLRIPGVDADDQTKQEFVEKLAKVDGIFKMPETQEDVAALYTKLGRPEEATGYKVDNIEGADKIGEAVDSYKQLAHEAGLTQAQFDVIMNAEITRLNSSEESLSANDAELKAKTAEIIKNEWVDFKAQSEGAKLTMNVLGNKFGTEYVDAAKAAAVKNPVLLAALSMAAQNLSEDSILDAKQPELGVTRAELEAEAREITIALSRTPSGKEAQRLMDKQLEIHRRLGAKS